MLLLPKQLLKERKQERNGSCRRSLNRPAAETQSASGCLWPCQALLWVTSQWGASLAWGPGADRSRRDGCRVAVLRRRLGSELAAVIGIDVFSVRTEGSGFRI